MVGCFVLLLGIWIRTSALPLVWVESSIGHYIFDEVHGLRRLLRLTEEGVGGG